MPCLAICGIFEGDAEQRVLFVLDVAHLAGVPDSIVTRAESISKEFFADLQEKLARRRRSKLSSIAQAGASYDLNVDINSPKRFHLLRDFFVARM
jgi:DNA mismatch repair ATPase MutS